MPTVTQVNLKLKTKATEEITQKFIEGVFAMAFDMAAQARRNAPYVTGALRNSIRVEDDSRGGVVYVKAGGIVSSGIRDGVNITRNVNYAWKAEQRSSRPHYMENAQKAIMTGDYLKKYFGGITK